VLTHELIISLAILASALLITGFFAFIYGMKRRPYQLWWTLGWLALTLRAAGPVLIGSWSPAQSPREVSPISQWLLGLAAMLFLISARRFAGMGTPPVLAGVVLVGLAAWAGANLAGWLTFPAYFGAAFLLLSVSSTFYREGQKQESPADRLLGIAFFFWGLLVMATAFRQRWESLWTEDLRLIVLLPQLFTAILMVMALYEEEKRRIERNMLALSNLNLATSSFFGGEIQKVLVQALERVLGVVRIPAGALVLQHADREAGTSLVATGLSKRFCDTAQLEGLDRHLVNMVARLGGIAVFRELGRESQWGETSREDDFRRFRELATQEKLRTMVCISLQAKERVFGVLMLGTADNRRFTPAELRLLLALGHQIGMAVENSQLVQQTSRRTEELHTLNEIGRALSSTLDTDQLFETIFSELQRLFDFSNFYIAFYDHAQNEVRFELEIINNVRQPKRRRTAGNHLSEYMIRTRQPVLIREHYLEEMRKLNVDSLRTTGSFCGVPLVLYDRAIGAMGVSSPEERAFDEAHLELMRVLASQAGIAIENARLFAEEQKKSRHLNLINNISRHAITTLNPDELLNEIVQQMEASLPYCHIGIAMLDYASKEVVVQAEAGRRREALGRRMMLGQGLLGQVARSGQMTIVRGAGSGNVAPVLSGSKSSIALPINYADQLLGVLYVESAEIQEFSDEEILLLRTLADLLAGALHNAQTFQKAQEQAITDGLTGLKTHRFFMEALAAEWKRATRAGRGFSLVLIDLDRFKFVNDFHGHLAGDAVLQRIARVLEQNCRRSDVVSRYGGDEFVVMMPETNLDQALQLAGKLRYCIENEPLLREKNITGSFGLSAFPLHGSTPQELIQAADSAMYISKHQGGNRVSTLEQAEAAEGKHWKRDVLEAYLGVTLKRLFSTGPEAYAEIYRRLEQFASSVKQNPEAAHANGHGQVVSGLPFAVIEMLTSLALAVDGKDHFTQGHSPKVSNYAVALARGLADAHGNALLNEAQIEEIRVGGLLHDVGKVGIPEVILNKGVALSSDEWEVVKTHAALGARIFEPLGAGRDLQLMIRHHHEYFDGSGYPDRLAGEAIPLGARIIAIADAFDTILSERTYKRARTFDEGLKEIERCAGAQFDPHLVAAFLRVMRLRPLDEAPARVPAAPLQNRAS
jgi:diguanylate cyclase (GGDEF)-like protein